jgi:glutamate-1-semialdehyde 2,1-aminomutase
MENISPLGPVYQAGTFSGNPISLTAGIETIKILEEVLDDINKKSDVMNRSLSEIAEDKNYFFSGVASMFQMFFTNKRVNNYNDAMQCDKDEYMKFFRRMLNEGIYLPPSQFETNFISAAHSKEDLEKTVEVYKKCL